MLDTVMTMINACGDDVYFYTGHNTIYLTVNDFEGFSKDWRVIMRNYNHPDAVNALLDWLNKNCISRTNNFYTIYSFDGFAVKVGYASFNI